MDFVTPIFLSVLRDGDVFWESTYLAEIVRHLPLKGLCVALSKTDPVQLFRRTQSFWWRCDFWLNDTLLSAVAESLYLIKVSKCSLGHKKYEQKFFPFIPTCRNHARMQWRFLLWKDQGQQCNKGALAELPWGQVTQLSRSGDFQWLSSFLCMTACQFLKWDRPHL